MRATLTSALKAREREAKRPAQERKVRRIARATPQPTANDERERQRGAAAARPQAPLSPPRVTRATLRRLNLSLDDLRGDELLPAGLPDSWASASGAPGVQTPVVEASETDVAGAKRIRQSATTATTAAQSDTKVSLAPARPALMGLPRDLWPGVAGYLDDETTSRAKGTAAGAAGALDVAQDAKARTCRATTRCGQRCAEIVSDPERYATLDLGCKRACWHALAPKVLRGWWLEPAKKLEATSRDQDPPFQAWRAFRPMFAATVAAEVVPKASAHVTYDIGRVYPTKPQQPGPFGSLERDEGLTASLEYVGGAGVRDKNFMVDLGLLRDDERPGGLPGTAAAVALPKSWATRYRIFGPDLIEAAFDRAITNPTTRRIYQEVQRVTDPVNYYIQLRQDGTTRRAHLGVQVKYASETEVAALLPLMHAWLPRNYLPHLLRLGSEPFEAWARGAARDTPLHRYALRDVPMKGCAGHEAAAAAAVDYRAGFPSQDSDYPLMAELPPPSPPPVASDAAT